MDNIELLIRNQYLLGKDVEKLSELKHLKKIDKGNLIANSLGISSNSELRDYEVMEILKCYYSDSKRKLSYLKKKYKFNDIVIFMDENRIKYIHRTQIVMKDIDIVKCYVEYFKSLTGGVLKVGTKHFTFYEYFQSMVRTTKDLKNLSSNQELVSYSMSILPKYEGHSNLTRIYGGQLFCNRERLDYGELLANTFFYMAFPYPFNTKIVVKLLSNFEERGNFDLSLDDNLIFLGFILSETLGVSFRDIFSNFRFTDLSETMKYGLMIFPYNEDYLIKVGDKLVPCDKNELNEAYKLGKL